MEKRFLTFLFIFFAAFFSCENIQLPKQEKKKEKKEEIEPIITIQNRFASIIEKATPSIVTVFTYAEGIDKTPIAYNIGDEEPFSESESLGSGFVYKEDNDFLYILTNSHVIEKSKNIVVKFFNGVEKKGKTVGIDTKSDLAVLKVKKEEKINSIHPLPIGTTKSLKVGYFVIAGGSPYNLGHTFTLGIVSALHRNLGISTYENYIQTDAAINPGDSGGPLLDIYGNVVGVNTAIIQSGQGLGFAIPIDDAIVVADELIKYGKVRRGWLGVVVQNLSKKQKKHLKVEKGVYIIKVVEDSPAFALGLKKGDVIIEINGEKIETAQQLKYILSKLKPKDDIKIKIYRKGKVIVLSTKLGEMLDKGI
ncbi:MAG: PDZ domain-containing protein [Aquificae bacterium]|nr:PDZ domain-containing protein [Aquificota bacterium]